MRAGGADSADSHLTFRATAFADVTRFVEILCNCSRDPRDYREQGIGSVI